MRGSSVMPQFSNILIVSSYTMLAVIGGVAAYQFAGITLGVSILIGAAVFLFCGQAHSLFGRAKERALFEGELVKLHRTQRIVGEELERTRDRMREMADLSEAKAVARNDHLISEVRLLETLVEQMADGVRKKAKAKMDQAAEAGEEDGDPEVHPKSVRYASDLKDVFDQLSEAELINVIQGSLSENRVDIYFQPIVSLPQRKVRFYEGFSRLRTEDDDVIEPKQYLRIAESTGVITLIDNLLLFRCVQLVRRILRRQQDVAIFCNISQHTLADQEFFPQFLDFMQANRDLNKLLVFEFGQETMKNCSPTEKSNLRRLADLGFRFSLDKVRSLELDLGELQDRHFRFIKVEPDILLRALPDEEKLSWNAEPIGLDEDENGLVAEFVEQVEVVDPWAPAEDSQNDELSSDEGAQSEESGGYPQQPSIHAADFKELLNRYGLDLIVEKIETEREVIEVVELDVDYGQGYLFGEPRPLKDSELDDTIPEPEAITDSAAAS